MIPKARGLDISRWQGSFCAEKARAAGIDAVICRCAYAASEDSCWEKFAPAVVASGMALGAYGFLTAHYHSKNGGSPEAAREAMNGQVDAWLELCRRQGCGLLAIDQELETGSVMALTKEENTALLAAACRRIAAAGVRPVVYASASWVQSFIDWPALEASLWVAWYPAATASANFTAWGDGTFPAGKYGDLLRELLAAGRLFAWQYGSTGWGEYYGASSANIDRNWLYQPIKEETPMYTSDTLKIGPVSAGDRATLRALAESLYLPAWDAGDYLIVGPMSSGDRAAVANKALALGLPCQDCAAPEPEEEPVEGGEDAPPAADTEGPAGEAPGDGQESEAARLEQVLAALERIETLQQDTCQVLGAVCKRLAAAGAQLAG